MSRFEEMYDAVQHRLLTSTYEVAYAYLREHPDYDGYPGEDVPRLLRCASRPGTDEPYPGIRDVARTTRDEWVRARLEAVARGHEEPGSCLASGGGHP